MRDPLPKYVWLNDRFVRSERAYVSVFDRGLQYGDGLFETLRAYDGRVFAVEEHIARLRASARLLHLTVPRIAWTATLLRLLEKNDLKGDAWIRVVLTRGTAAPSLLPPPRLKPNLIVIAGSLDPNLRRVARRGVRVDLLPFAVEGLLAGHKTLSYVPAILGKHLARKHGAYEGLYVDTRGQLSEGTTSNLFLVVGGTLLTPPERGILPGVTRRKVIALCRELGLHVREKPLRATVLPGADEAFLSSSLAEIVPITQVGQHAIGTGRPGQVTKQLQCAYRAMVRETLDV